MIDQRSDEWFSARLGKVTASRVADVMARTKTGYGAPRANYMTQLLCERLTGKREEGFTSQAMQRGTDKEPLARSSYEVITGNIVIETGLIDHPKIKNFGASPDGLVSTDGVLEIKCPNTAKHIEFIRTGIPDNQYQWQMLCQMSCAERAWCDFVSFDDRLPDSLQMFHIRFQRDDARVTEMEKEVAKFLAELDAMENELRNKMAKAA